MGTDDRRRFDDSMRRIESLIRDAERIPDPAAQDAVRGLVAALMDVNAAGIARMLELIAGCGEGGRRAVAACAADPVVSGLLLMYGLHPDALEMRVRAALNEVCARLKLNAGDVELADAAAGAVRIRIKPNGGCSTTTERIRAAVEEAVADAAPDAASIEIEGGPRPVLFPLPMAGVGR